MPAPIVPLPATPTVLICVIRSLPDETAADKLPVDLVGAFPDLGDFRVAHQALDAVVLAVAVAAVQLHRFGGDAHREIGRAHLEHRRFDAELARAAVDEPRDVP